MNFLIPLFLISTPPEINPFDMKEDISSAVYAAMSGCLEASASKDPKLGYDLRLYYCGCMTDAWRKNRKTAMSFQKVCMDRANRLYGGVK